MNPNNKKALTMAFALGIEMTVSIVVGVFLGYYLGKFFQFAEWGAVVGSFLGLSIWVWRLIATKRYLG